MAYRRNPIVRNDIPSYAEAQEAERRRVAGLIAIDQQDLAERNTALLDPGGERRLIRPTPLIAARRAISANGHSEAECTDTIGKLWSWGLLDGTRLASDLLRDAGRRYAAAYWFRYGNVCAHIGAYSDMTRGSGGPKKTFIADPAVDLLVEDRFRRRDAALRDVHAKIVVDQVCVDGAGDNDPMWLIELMTGYHSQTRAARFSIIDIEKYLASNPPSIEAEKAAVKLRAANRKLKNEIKYLMLELLPHKTIGNIKSGLVELAEIDRSEGLHRPKRGRPKKQGEKQ